MKKSEIEALKEAFNIPEPERKNSFLPFFKEQLKKNKSRLCIPMFFRYASAAVLAAVIIGLWGVLNPSVDFTNEPDNSFIVVESDATTEATASGTGTHTSTDSEASDKTDISQTTIAAPPAVTEVTGSEQNEIHYTSTAEITQTEPAPNTTAVSTAVTTEATQQTTPAVSATTTSYQELPVATTTTSYQELPVATTTKVTQDLENNPSVGVRDYTVSPSVVYDKTGVVIDLRDVEMEDNLPIPPPSLDSVSILEAMAHSSDYIVYAVIDEIIYTEIDGKPFTQENLTIYSVYKGGGEIDLMDRISLYVPGGYMPADEYLKNNDVIYDFPENSVVYDYGGNGGTQELYNSYIFFLKSGNDSMPHGAFQLTEKTDISVFEYSGGKNVSLGNSALSFTQSELLSLLQ